MNDSYSWIGRFQDWQNRFGSTSGNSAGNHISSESGSSSSNQMEDYADVVYLKDYHIYEVQDDQMDDGSYNIALKGTKTLSFDFQNVDDFINQTKAPEGHTFDEKDYDEVK